MNADLWLPSDATCKKPSEHAAGTLIALAPQSAGSSVIWGLRFDDAQSGKNPECLYLLNGSPFGEADSSTVLNCGDGNIDNLAVIGLGAPNFRVRIELSADGWVSDNQMYWYDAKAHVVFGEFGTRLCGYDRFRPQNSQVWINCETWQADNVGQLVSSRSSLITAYAPTWRVIAERSQQERITVEFARPSTKPQGPKA